MKSKNNVNFLPINTPQQTHINLENLCELSSGNPSELNFGNPTELSFVNITELSCGDSTSISKQEISATLTSGDEHKISEDKIINNRTELENVVQGL